MYVKASDNWVALLGESRDHHNCITDLNGLTPAQALETLLKAHGPGSFRVMDHGTVIVCYSTKGKEIYLQKRRDEGKGCYIGAKYHAPGEF